MKKLLALTMAFFMVFNLIPLAGMQVEAADYEHTVHIINKGYYVSGSAKETTIIITDAYKKINDCTDNGLGYWGVYIIERLDDGEVVEYRIKDGNFTRGGQSSQKLAMEIPTGGFAFLAHENKGQKQMDLNDIGKFVTFNFDLFSIESGSYKSTGYGKLTIGAEHTHRFKQRIEEAYKVEDSVATCEQGVYYYESCICDAKGTETFEDETTRLGHIWNYGEIDWEKDDVNGGYKATATRTCSRAAHTYTIDATVTFETEAAKCGVDGKTTYSAVALFDDENKEITGTKVDTIDAPEHISPTTIEKVDSTCQKKGHEAYKYCTACNTALEEIVVINEKAHRYSAFVSDENGKSHTMTCLDCKAEDGVIATITEDCSDGKNGSTATCTQKAICVTCGGSYGNAKGHNYLPTVTQPTCTTKGYTTHTCSECGDSYVDSYTAATAHTYTSVVTKPTCTAQGYTTHTCSGCGTEYIDSYVGKTGHSYVTATTTAPTCTEKGMMVNACSVCGDTVTVEYGEPTGHNYKSEVTAPTCTEQGYTTHTCSKCNDSYKDTYTDAAGHSYTSVVTAPTCTAQGYTTHTCSKCNDSYKDIYTALVGHSYTSVVTAPTCMAQGYTTHTCSVCNSFYVDTYIDPVDHDYDRTKAEANLIRPVYDEASDTWSQAYYTYSCKFGCSQTITENVSRASYSAYDTAWNNLQILMQSTSDETVKQAIKNVLDANKIDKNLIASEQSIVNTAEVNLKAAYELYSNSGVFYTVTFDVNGVEITTTVAHGTAATAPGKVKKPYDDVYHYEFAGWDKEFDNVTEDITVTAQFNSIKHDYTTHDFKDENSHTSACTCGHKIDDEHSYNGVVTEKATCEKNGVKTYTCSLCGDQKEEAIEKRDHVYRDNGVQIPATCKTEGVMNTICTNEETDTHEACNHTSTSAIPVNSEAHTKAESFTVMKKATCEADGYEAKLCIYCEKELETQKIEKRDHVYKNVGVQKPATCKTEGVMNTVCSNVATDTHEACNHTSTAVIPVDSNAHEKANDFVVIKKATCEADGYEAKLCVYCNKELETQKIEKRDHVYIDNGVKTPATCSATGVMNTICSNIETQTHEACSHESTQVIPIDSDAHKEETDYTVKQKATCEADGYKAILCEYCNAELKKVTIVKRAHVYKDNGVQLEETCCSQGVMNTICTNKETDTHAACTHESTRVIGINQYKHTKLNKTDAVPESCTENGNIDYWTCEGCKKLYTDKEGKNETTSDAVIVQKRHLERRLTISASCETLGYRETTCARCDYYNKTVYDKKGHSYSDWVMVESAKCGHGNIWNRTCSRCYKTDEYIDDEKGYHILVVTPGKDASCLYPGFTDHHYCVACNYSKQSTVIPQLDHVDNDGNGKCDTCDGIMFEHITCTCLCHKEGKLVQFIYKVVLFIWRLMGKNDICDCGAVHYIPEAD